METLAPTREERGAAMAQDMRVTVLDVECVTAITLDTWLANANKIEDALDLIGDINRWPLFAALLSTAVSYNPPEIKLAALARIKTLLSDALADDAGAEAMRMLGVKS